jgi:hypothetical protein
MRGCRCGQHCLRRRVHFTHPRTESLHAGHRNPFPAVFPPGIGASDVWDDRNGAASARHRRSVRSLRTASLAPTETTASPVRNSAPMLRPSRSSRLSAISPSRCRSRTRLLSRSASRFITSTSWRSIWSRRVSMPGSVRPVSSSPSAWDMVSRRSQPASVSPSAASNPSARLGSPRWRASRRSARSAVRAAGAVAAGLGSESPADHSIGQPARSRDELRDPGRRGTGGDGPCRPASRSGEHESLQPVGFGTGWYRRNVDGPRERRAAERRSQAAE